MKVCRRCGKSKRLEEFTKGKAICRPCRAKLAREQRRPPMSEEEEQRRFREWQERMMRQHEASNARARELGWQERPPPDIEPGWLERLQARAQAKMSASRR
jgi:hypothetical protein